MPKLALRVRSFSGSSAVGSARAGIGALGDTRSSRNVSPWLSESIREVVTADAREGTAAAHGPEGTPWTGNF